MPLFLKAAQESRGSRRSTPAFLCCSDSSCVGVQCPSLALCHHLCTCSAVTVYTKTCYSYHIPLHSGTVLHLCSSCSWTNFIGGKEWPTFQEIFLDIYDSSSSIHHLLPPPCLTSLLSWLRAATPFPCLISRTQKHCYPPLHYAYH